MSPGIFQGVIGHEAAKRILALAVERPHGAYLIVGPDGVGAHALAERFVRALSGHEAAKPLTSHPDIAVLAREPSSDEKAAKSIISVEAVRELRERVARRPVLAPRVVVYAPEADRLNEAGVNALLKSMEEPGAGAVFVLVTHDESRLPATLKSRTARLTLSRVPSREIDEWLAARGVKAADRAQAVEIAEGRPGQALRWLEESDVRAAVQTAAHTVERFLSSRSAGEAFAALDAEAKRCDASDDPLQAWRDSLGRWSSTLRHAFLSDPPRALHLGHVFACAERQLGGPVSPRIWLELGLARCASGAAPVFPKHLPSTFPYPLPLS